MFITGLLFLLQGCVKQTAWPVKAPAPAKVIVDAILTDEVKTQKVTLTCTAAQLNQAAPPVSGASVIISNEDSTWSLTENPSNSGIYQTVPSFFTRPGKNYTLLISHNGNIYSAKATMIPGTYFPELKYSKNAQNNLY